MVEQEQLHLVVQNTQCVDWHLHLLVKSGPQGIHVAHIIIDGIINTPNLRERYQIQEDDPLLEPDAIASTYWGTCATGKKCMEFRSRC